MGTISIIGNVIKNKKSHEFKINDSYAFRNASDFLAVLFDFDRFIEIIDKYGPVFGGDSFVSSNIEPQIEILQSNFKKVYKELEETGNAEFRSPGRITRLTINLDNEWLTIDDEMITFPDIRLSIVADVFKSL